MNGAWVTAHLMEHYRYAGDREFLREQAWPAIRANAQFVLSWLHRDEQTGKWITGPGTSPENAFFFEENGEKVEVSISCGTTHDQMLAWESLADLVEAAEALGLEDDLIARARQVLPDLAEGQIGPDGRLQEWREPYEEIEAGHRHVSHAYGFFPGRQYNLIEDPQVAGAIQKSLDFRLKNGGGHTGWSRAWLINIEAVLMRPEAAYDNLRTLLSKLITAIRKAAERNSQVTPSGPKAAARSALGVGRQPRHRAGGLCGPPPRTCARRTTSRSWYRSL